MTITLPPSLLDPALLIPKSAVQNSKQSAIRHSAIPFGAAADLPMEAAQKAARAITPIARENASNFLKKFFGKTNKELKVFNFSLEDITSRFTTFFALQVPQSVISLAKRTLIFETNARHVLGQFMNFGVAIFLKSPKASFNAFVLDRFMKDAWAPASRAVVKQDRKVSFWKRLWTFLRAKKTSPVSVTVKPYQPIAKKDLPRLSRLDRLLHPFRFKGVFSGERYYPADYLHLMETVGIPLKPENHTEAHWITQDLNRNDRILAFVKQLEEKKSKTGQLTPEEALHMKMGKAFVIRCFAFNFLNTVFATLLTAYLLGKVMTDIIFKYIAPLDKDNRKDRPPKDLLLNEIKRMQNTQAPASQFSLPVSNAAGFLSLAQRTPHAETKPDIRFKRAI